VNRRHLIRCVIAAVLVAIWMLGPGATVAEAYIDPGTGSSILGSIGIIFAVISAFAAVAFQHVRGCLSWIVCKLGTMVRKSSDNKEPAHESA